MSFLDALFGNAPTIEMPTLAKAYQAPGLDFASAYGAAAGAAGGARGQQLGYLDTLRQAAAGAGPGALLAEAQLKGDLNRAEAGVAGQIASNRGLSPATKAFLLAQRQGQASAGAAAGAAATRAQQQIAATGQLGNAVGQLRQQDLTAQQLAQVGQLGQSQLASANFNEAQRLNAQMGMGQAQMEAQANQAGLQNISGMVNSIGEALPAIKKMFAHGGPVDSYANDTVPAMLSPGEIVIPRSIAQGPSAPEKSADFVEHILRQEKERHARTTALVHALKMAEGGPVPERVWPLGVNSYYEVAARQKAAEEAEADKAVIAAQNAEAEKAADLNRLRAYGAAANSGVGFTPGMVHQETPPAPSSPGAQFIVPPKPGSPAAALLHPAAAPASASKPVGGAPSVPSAASGESSPEDRRARLEAGFYAAAEHPMEKAMRENSEIDAGVARRTAETYQQHAEQTSNLLAERNARVERNLADIKKVSEEIPDQNKWYKEQSTAGKITAGIGLLLSGIGSGITGQKNKALEFIQGQIDRDIKLQMDKKDSMLAYFKAKGHADEEAYQLAQSVANNKVADTLNSLAAQATSDKARNDLMMLQNTFRMRAAEFQLDVAKKGADLQIAKEEAGLKRAEASKAGMEAAKTGMEARKLGLETGLLQQAVQGGGTGYLPTSYQDMRERGVRGPGGERAFAKTPDMAKQITETMTGLGEFKDATARMRDWLERNGTGGAIAGDKVQELEQLKGDLMLSYARAKGVNPNAMPQTDAELFKRALPDPGKVFTLVDSQRALTNLEAMAHSYAGTLWTQGTNQYLPSPSAIRRQ